MTQRIWVGGAWHETHSFAVDVTTRENFRLHHLVAGEALLETFTGTSTEIGGALAACASESGVEVIPGFFAGALPSGPIAAETWAQLRSELLRSIAESRPDAVFLSLHGAMVVHGEPDPEGRLVREIRARVGNDVPIGVTLDYHANLGPDLVAAADVVVAYDTYPHTDFAERGSEVAATIMRMLRGERFARAHVQLPIAPPVPAQATAEAPMKELLALAHRLEEDGRTLVSWMAGFPYADVPRMGMSAVVTASRPAESLTALAETLAQAAWDRRNDFHVNLTPVADAVREAASASEGPVVLVDVADNVGGGAPGDGTAILHELLRQRVRGSVVSIADRESVLAAEEAGLGSVVSLRLGGKTDDRHGEPVSFTGTVRWLGDGRFTLQGSWMKGLSLDPGRTAVVESEDGISVVISERKVPPFDAGVLQSVGIDPRQCRVIVAKSAIAWRSAYGAVARRAIYVDTPGICTPHLERLTYRARRRPLLPFERETSFSDRRLHVWAPGERSVDDGRRAAASS